jgi:hypothetical protein
MSNSDTPTTATPYPDSYISVGWRYSLEAIHTMASIENSLRRFEELGNAPVDTLLFSVAEARLERDNWREEASKDVPAGDQRIDYLWHKLWDALSGDIEQDETWGLFMDAIPGVPDFRKETVSGSITLTFGFSELEIPGGLSGGERDDAIIEAYLDDNDFDQDYADSTEVTEH